MVIRDPNSMNSIHTFYSYDDDDDDYDDDVTFICRYQKRMAHSILRDIQEK